MSTTRSLPHPPLLSTPTASSSSQAASPAEESRLRATRRSASNGRGADVATAETVAHVLESRAGGQRSDGDGGGAMGGVATGELVGALERIRMLLAMTTELRAALTTAAEHIAAPAPASTRKAADAVDATLAAVQAVRAGVAALPPGVCSRAARADADAVARAPAKTGALLAAVAAAGRDVEATRARAAAVAMADAARAVFPGLLTGAASRKRSAASLATAASAYALTPPARPSKRRKGLGAIPVQPLPGPLALFLRSATPRFRATAWRFAPASTRLASLSLALPAAGLAIKLDFAAAVGLAEPDTLVPAAVDVCVGTDDASAVARRLTALASDAMDHFNAESPGRALPPLLSWLHSYHDLFTRPCSACDAVLAWAPERDTMTWLPPTLRPFRNSRLHTRALAPLLGTVATTGSPLRAPLALRAPPAFHEPCFLTAD